MSDIKLFSINGEVRELAGGNVVLEREIQTIIENNMVTFFGVRFLASEYRITDGRMDSIGIDENYCPVIFEYKRSVNENVINQGLFYLDWLVNHKADFEVLVIRKYGLAEANKIDWSRPRVICIAGDFTKYDEFAINQMSRNIALIRYKKYGNDLLMFEQLNENVAPPLQDLDDQSLKPARQVVRDKTFTEQLESASDNIKNLYQDVRDFANSQGDDVKETTLNLYTAFKKIRNFLCVVIQSSRMRLYLRLDPKTVVLEEGFTRDVTNIGHWATGDVEVTIENLADFEKAKPLITRAYNET